MKTTERKWCFLDSIYMVSGAQDNPPVVPAVYLPTLMPVGWKLWSHAGSCLQANFSRLIENVSCHLAWHNFQKYFNSDPCKERKPCEKWINDNTFLAMSDFWSEKHWERARIYTCPKTSENFGRLRKTSDFFEWLQTSSGIFGNDCVVLKNPSTPRIKISRLYLRKSWQVYCCRGLMFGVKQTIISYCFTLLSKLQMTPLCLILLFSYASWHQLRRFAWIINPSPKEKSWRLPIMLHVPFLILKGCLK